MNKEFNFSISFSDFGSLEGLCKIDEMFLQYLLSKDQSLYELLLHYRSSIYIRAPDPFQHSQFLLSLAPYVDDFIAEMFTIEPENLLLKAQQKQFDVIYECRRKFVQRIFKDYQKKSRDSSYDLETNYSKAAKELTRVMGRFTEVGFAEHVVNWLAEANKTKFSRELEIAGQFALAMVLGGSSLSVFKIPREIDSNNLIRANRVKELAENIQLGFDYRDSELTAKGGFVEAKYCLYCHHQQKDSCRFGITKAKTGCPLDQKISEANELMSRGFNIGALGVMIIDNPLLVLTGHRICNDCMKSCIFQKQDPVNVPLAESAILANVLRLPYGVEIYLLLTKWNPLNIAMPLPKPQTRHHVMVAGSGPAGIALSYYLLRDGHSVVAIDGLKIEPLILDLHKPIKDYKEIRVALSQKLPQGFGGAAEYGVTSRWDKNNLILARLVLARSIGNFALRGGIRLGSNITAEQVFQLGFEHLALCLGAGKPRYIDDASYFHKGVMSATDFLMQLHQNGSYLEHSGQSEVSKLLIRMPVVVIGCGLTAIDSAVEAIHYYMLQIERYLSLYEQNQLDLESLSIKNRVIVQEFIDHARLFRNAGSAREKLAVIQQLGGVSICYRKTIKESPAYCGNHEEIEHAMAAGVRFLENLLPRKVMADEYGWSTKIEFELKNVQERLVLDAKTVLIAIGTEWVQPAEDLDVLRLTDGMVSCFGDYTENYTGSVVKALASAKDGYKTISDALSRKRRESSSGPDIVSFGQLQQIFDTKLGSRIEGVEEVRPYVINLIIKSPLVVENYTPGQIFRLQNYAVNKPDKIAKPFALRPYMVDRQKGLIGFIIAGGSKLFTDLKRGDEIALMGPTASGTTLPEKETVILIGHDIGNLALLPIAEQVKSRGSKIIFVAGYYRASEQFWREKIEMFADELIWVSEEGLLEASSTRDQDIVLKGDIITAIRFLADKDSGRFMKGLPVLCYVSNKVLKRIKHEVSAAIWSNFRCNVITPMGCMMKGICGRCIQKVNDKPHIDIGSGNRKGYIFACACSEYVLEEFEPKI